jgi:hypothetical protein
MDSHEAKKILALYRPDSIDAADAKMAEALEAAQRDPELAAWLEQHCAVFNTIRGKLREIPVPADLKRRIILEKPSHRRIIELPMAVRLLAAAAAITALIALASFWFTGPKENLADTFRRQMASKIERGYAMNFHADDQDKIRAEFIARNAPVDYVLSPALKRLPGEGGAVFLFNNHQVEMLCLYDGRDAQGHKNGLWLFVASKSLLADSPPSAKPQIVPEGELMTATWTAGDKIYLLAVTGDEKAVQKYLE